MHPRCVLSRCEAKLNTLCALSTTNTPMLWGAAHVQSLVSVYNGAGLPNFRAPRASSAGTYLIAPLFVCPQAHYAGAMQGVRSGHRTNGYQGSLTQ